MNFAGDSFLDKLAVGGNHNEHLLKKIRSKLGSKTLLNHSIDARNIKALGASAMLPQAIGVSSSNAQGGMVMLNGGN